MKVQMNKTQLQAMCLLLERGLLEHQPKKLQGKLIHTLVDKLYERVRKKTKKAMLSASQGYGMTWNDVEAMAFFVWYHNLAELLRPQYHYECIVADRIVGEIDREYA